MYWLDGEWRAAEGIGLTFGYSRQYTDNVGSGRVENYSPYLFRAAKIEVFGSTTNGKPFNFFSSLSFCSSNCVNIYKLQGQWVWKIFTSVSEL